MATSRHSEGQQKCPLYPQQRTLDEPFTMSEIDPKRTSRATSPVTRIASGSFFRTRGNVTRSMPHLVPHASWFSEKYVQSDVPCVVPADLQSVIEAQAVYK